MKLLNFTIIKLVCCLIIGIIISHLCTIPLQLSLSISGILLLVLLIFFIVAKNQFRKTIWFGLTVYILMIFVGILNTSFHNPKNLSNHYTNHQIYQKDTINAITFRIREILKPGKYNDKYVIDVLKIKNTAVTGKSLLNIKKDTTKTVLNVDDILICNTHFTAIKSPLNPNQFDYQSYLEKQYIYHQIFTTKHLLFKLNHENKTLSGIAHGIKLYINEKLRRYPFGSDELAIIKALLLGQRHGISEDTYRDYVNAGAIHILAISGLHVGIILLILNTLFSPIERFKNGKFIKTIIVLMVLWAFAFITGLSASVVRATTMFSVVAIAMSLKRPTNIYNTLAISMFFILLFKPLYVFDVGFQLSYLAVFTIVTIDPLLQRLWSPKLWFLTKLWRTLTVTLSAQFGILPLSLFYFHQFPGLFFLSNLIIVPLLGIILGFGLLVILLASIDLLPTVLAQTYGQVISVMNVVINWVSQQDAFIFKNIPFNTAYLLTSLLFIVAIVKVLKRRTIFNLRFLFISILCFQGAVIFTAFYKSSNQLIIFHKNRYSLLGKVEKNTIFVNHDFDSLTQRKSNIINDFTVGNHIDNIEECVFESIYLLGEKKFLVVDSLGVYNVNTFQPDYVLLRQSPKLNLNRLIDSIGPKQIIADGSNFKSYIEYWETICKKRKLPFHHTGKQGAYFINY